MNLLFAVAVALVPDLVRLVAGDKAGSFSDKVASVIKNATNTDDQAAAQTKIDQDPALKISIQKQLADIALEETKEQNRAEEARRSIELEALKEQFAESARIRDFSLTELREEIQSIRGAQSFYTDIVRSGSAVAWVNPALSGIVTVGFLVLVYLLLFYPPAATESNQVFNIALGALATAFATVIGFHFGSSAGSKQKDEVNSVILAQRATQADNAPPGPTPVVNRKPDLPRPTGVTPDARPAGVTPEVRPAAGGPGEPFETKAPGIMARLIKDLGITASQAAGVLGNIGHECAGFQHFQEIGIKPPQGGWGWCQWTGLDRKECPRGAEGGWQRGRGDEGLHGEIRASRRPGPRQPSRMGGPRHESL